MKARVRPLNQREIDEFVTALNRHRDKQMVRVARNFKLRLQRQQATEAMCLSRRK